MKKYNNNSFIAFSILGFFFCSLYGLSIERSPAKPLVLSNVNVVDTLNGAIEANMTVVVDGKKISRIGKAGDVFIPENAEVIEAAENFLIAGLWDMHTHWYETDYLPLFIANGVTGIRLMHGAQTHFDWRKDIEQGKQVGPRMVVASRILDGPDPQWRGSVVVTNDQQAIEAIQQARNVGCDFIKVYTKLSQDAYYSIADHCRKQNMPFAGHVPSTISILEASEAGQKSIEHMDDFIRGCSSQEDVLQLELQNKPRSMDQVIEKALDSFDQAKANSLAKAFMANNTWLCPTLNLHRNYYLCFDRKIYSDPRLEYLPQFLRNEWQSKHNMRLKLYTDKYRTSAETIFAGYLRMIGFLKNAGYGGMILTGTDTGNPYCMPGFSLHDELKFLVMAGLTPSQALKASTYNAARFLNQEDSMGAIKEGYLADLVLLEANPLDDIQNTKKIAAVIFNGKLYTKKEIQQMLSRVKAMKTN